MLMLSGQNLLLGAYLLMGLGVYLAALAIRPNSLKGASAWSIVKGILGTLAWPIILIVLYFKNKNNSESNKEHVV
jgi:hypothetical protein